MNAQILDYFSESRGSHLHANGESSTNRLIDLIDCKPGEKVLELGFGTGATLIQMASTFKKTSFYGIETSKKMYHTAAGRVRFSLLDSRVELQHWDGLELPFKTNSIDKIYVESVLGIQSKKSLNSILSEFSRVLKHDGVLLFNETIWLDSTQKNVITEVNSACIESFGIVQSSGDFPYLSDWLALLRRHGFEVKTSMKLPESSSLKKRFKLSRNVFLSRIYSNIGWWKSKLNPRLRRDWKTYQKHMNSILIQEEPLMSGVIVHAINER